MHMFADMNFVCCHARQFAGCCRYRERIKTSTICLGANRSNQRISSASAAEIKNFLTDHTGQDLGMAGRRWVRVVSAQVAS